MKYLVESIGLTESKVALNESKEKRYLIEGIFMQSEVRNGNGRVYPEHIMDKEVTKYIKEKVEKNMAVGELNHPVAGRDPRIDYEYVSHKIESLVKNGHDWIGRAVITKNTPKGALVAGLMDEGVVMGVSSRALGSVQTINGVKMVQDDFTLITPADIVADPSAPDAYMTNLMEGKEWIFEGGILVEREIEELQSHVNTLARNNKLDQSEIINIFENVFYHKFGSK